MVKHRADLGSAEDDDHNENGQDKQPAHDTASLFPIHGASFLLNGRKRLPALIPFEEPGIVTQNRKWIRADFIA
jgi:hypothetical protein